MWWDNGYFFQLKESWKRCSYTRLTRDGATMQNINNFRQKILGSALAGAFIFMCAYGAGTGMYWITVVGAVGIGYLLKSTMKPKVKQTISA